MKNTYEDALKSLERDKAHYLKDLAIELHTQRVKVENLLEPMRQKVAKLEAEHTSLAEARGELEEDLVYARKDLVETRRELEALESQHEIERQSRKEAELEVERLKHAVSQAITWLVLVKSGIPHWKAYEYAELALKALQGKS